MLCAILHHRDAQRQERYRRQDVVPVRTEAHHARQGFCGSLHGAILALIIPGIATPRQTGGETLGGSTSRDHEEEKGGTYDGRRHPEYSAARDELSGPRRLEQSPSTGDQSEGQAVLIETATGARTQGPRSGGPGRGRTTAGRVRAPAGRSHAPAGRSYPGYGRVPPAPGIVPSVTLVGDACQQGRAFLAQGPLALWAQSVHRTLHIVTAICMHTPGENSRACDHKSWYRSCLSVMHSA
jgi:hypothetical protein